VLEGSVSGRSGATPYVRFGDSIALGAALAVIAVALSLLRWQRRSPAA
jgi:apolipoprotein N-acyltransferase